MQILQVVMFGLLLGGVYALLSSGLSLIFGVLDVVNVAQGAFLVSGAFLTWKIWKLTGIEPLLLLPLVTLLWFGLGILIFRGLFARVAPQGPSMTVLLSFGLALIFEGALNLLFGNQFKSIQTSYSLNSVTLGSIVFPLTQIIACTIAAITLGLMYVYLKTSWSGRALRATAQNRDGAALIGISHNKSSSIAYGLGMAQVAPALASAGCRTFVVAHLGEGVALRHILADAEIHVLNGLMPGTAATFGNSRLVPVLNSLGDIDAWAAFCRGEGRRLPADIHIDTGMSRLGLPPVELDALADDPARLRDFTVGHVMSHLACADEPDHPMNRDQLERFRQAIGRLPAAKRSFANSAGIFLGPDFHFDLARPGIALYGGNPRPGQPNPMAQVLRLQGKILQVRDVDTPQTVGYGASHRISGPGRIATVAVGYADGFLRSLGNAGWGFVGDIRAPIVGRVSMDLITLDVTAVPEPLARPGGRVDLIGPHNPIDAVADAAGTISYEILTGLGPRYHRVYVGGGG